MNILFARKAEPNISISLWTSICILVAMCSRIISLPSQHFHFTTFRSLSVHTICSIVCCAVAGTRQCIYTIQMKGVANEFGAGVISLCLWEQSRWKSRLAKNWPNKGEVPKIENGISWKLATDAFCSVSFFSWSLFHKIIFGLSAMEQRSERDNKNECKLAERFKNKRESSKLNIELFVCTNENERRLRSS